MSNPTHERYHELAKVAATEALSSAINHIRKIHGTEILAQHPTLLSALSASYSRVYAAQIIAEALRSGQPEQTPAS